MSSELKEKSEKFRERLLDLSGRNNFVKYNHRTDKNKQRFLRIVNEIPELLIQKLRVKSVLESTVLNVLVNLDASDDVVAASNLAECAI